MALLRLYFCGELVAGAGEELGWRGYLQGRLIAHYGLSKGIAILGLLWPFWRLPLLAGYNYREHRYLGAFLFSPALLVAASFFMAWLTLRSRSFWPAALPHGAGNSIQGGLTASIKPTVPIVVSLLDRISGDHRRRFDFLVPARSGPHFTQTKRDKQVHLAVAR